MRKKIMFVMPTMGGGGAERVISILANSLSAKNYDVIIAVTKENKICYKLNDKVVIEINDGNTSPLGQILFIRKIGKKHNVDDILSFLTYQNMYTLLAFLFSDKKIIISERNDPSTTARGIAKLFREVLYLRADVIVFQTEMAKQYFKEIIQRKSIIIANPINVEELPYSIIDNRKKKIVCVARLEKQKNIFMLIRGYEQFLKLDSSYYLEIYGEGNLREDLEQYIISRDLQGKVILKGFVNDVYMKINDASVFALTSNHEGMSNAMLEALAMGIPCVCTDCPVGASREFITNGENGILIPVNDEKALCDALDQILLKNRLNNSQKHVEMIREKLSVSNISSRWESIL